MSYPICNSKLVLVCKKAPNESFIKFEGFFDTHRLGARIHLHENHHHFRVSQKTP